MGDEPRSEKEVVARFQELRRRVELIWSNINDLEAEASEHEMVIKTLEPMDAGRRCFRLIGGVLVERTVAEVLPAVQRNKEGLEQTVLAKAKQLEVCKKELAEFQSKYKIRIQGEDEGGAPSGSASGTSRPGQPQGVLVKGQ